jgi:hypothetical protein
MQPANYLYFDELQLVNYLIVNTYTFVLGVINKSISLIELGKFPAPIDRF